MDEATLWAVYHHDDPVAHLTFDCHEDLYREVLKECPELELRSNAQNLDLRVVSCSNLIVRDLDRLVEKEVV